ncbi:tetratricopeptide repeat protein [Candidatus Sumerlaeota bacterium]|nr:tetratricopeptide repeat protein [Candidatus Sumerlaeota bacterium]
MELRDFALEAYDEGLRFAEAGNDPIAIERFNRSIAIDPRPASYFQLAKAQTRTGEKDLPILAYVSALGMAPDFQEARIALMEMGITPPSEQEIRDHPEAFEKFKSETELEVQTRLAEAARKGKELTSEQRAALKEKIRMQKGAAAGSRLPTASEVHSVLFPATVADSEVMPSATDPTYSNDRDIILNTYPYHFGNGQRFQKNQEYEKASEEYQLALRLQPDSMDARINLGDCMLRLERFPQARFHYLTAVEQFPNSPRPLFKLGNFYESSQRIDLARQYYAQAIAKDPQYMEAYNNLAAIDIREKKYPDAIQRLKTAISMRPDYPLAYMNLGIAQEQSGDKVGALASYKKYVELGGDQAAEVSKWIQEME